MKIVMTYGKKLAEGDKVLIAAYEGGMIEVETIRKLVRPVLGSFRGQIAETDTRSGVAIVDESIYARLT